MCICCEFVQERSVVLSRIYRSRYVTPSRTVDVQQLTVVVVLLLSLEPRVTN